MSRKRQNAQKPAAGKPETVAQDQPADGAEQEAPDVVESDGDTASLGTEQPEGEGGQDGGSAQSWLVDPDVPYAPGSDNAVVQAAEQGGADQGDGTPADLGDGSALGNMNPPDNDDDGDPEDPDRTFSRALEADLAISGAFFAMQEAVKPLLFAVAGELEDLWIYDDLLTINGMGFLEAARFLREVGHARATVDVVATQLKLTGHLPAGSVDGPQKVLLEIFLFTLASLDGFAKAEADRKAKAEEEANRKPPPPVPIEDTTMEPVDDTMATW